MDAELAAIGGEPEVTPAGEPEAPKTRTVEDAAREKGWKPKEEFSGDEAEWVDAQEFVRREPLFEKIKGQSKELKKLQKTIEGMVQHYNANVQSQVQAQIAQLRAAKKEAIELGDVNQVDAIERQLTQVVTSAPKPQAPEVDPSLAEWVANPANKWFNEDIEMREFAVAYNESWLKRNPGQIADSLKKTDDAVRKAFPDKFKQVIKPPTVESGAQTKAGGGKYDTARLTPEQKLAYRAFVVTNKIMSHDDYFKSLVEIGAYE